MSDTPTARDFGHLEAQVDALDSKFGRFAEEVRADMRSMREQLDKLSHLAERGKGAFWFATLLASAVSGAVGWMFSSKGH